MPITEADIITAARDILGNKTDDSARELYVPDEAIVTGTFPDAILELNSKYGTAAGRKEVIFETVAGQQDYPVSTTVGNDVAAILTVTRSGAHMANHSFLGDPDDAIDAAGKRSGGGGIPIGLQPDAMLAIEGVHRFLRQDQFVWEEAYPGGTRSIRLMPVPSGTEVVAVAYTTSGASVETLPEEARQALVYAACVAILDAQINRSDADRLAAVTGSPDPKAHENRLRVLERQRDRYELLYRRALSRT